MQARRPDPMSRAGFGIAAFCLGLAACGSCNKDAPKDGATPSTSTASTPSNGAVAELLPRCRGDAQRLAIPGDDVIVGDVAIGPTGLLVGVVRVDNGKRIASIVRAPLDLASSRVIDIGPPLGDNPPPSPRWNGNTPYVAFIARHATESGAKLRELHVARLEESKLGKVEATTLQQADESTAFDVAWNEAGAGLVAWDEDAPPSADASAKPLTETYAPEGRGFVKVQAIGSAARRVASPESSDAESPRLLARPGGGFWLAWLARRAEDAGYAIESPGEKRAFRWVEIVPLTATGEPAGPVKRVSSEKGRAAAFELARSGSDLVVMVQDEAASSDGAGARIVRHLVGEKVDAADIVDGGVGTTVAELVPVASPGEAAHWLAWSDMSERAHLTPLGSGLVAAGMSTSEPVLDGARVLAAAAPDVLYALVGASSVEPAAPPGRPELRRFVCPLASSEGARK